jgi:hypothetical protein
VRSKKGCSQASGAPLSPLTSHVLPVMLFPLSLSLNGDLTPHAQREVRKTVDMVVAFRGTGEAHLIDGIGLGQERTLEWCHLIRHVLREYVGGAFWNAIRPERHVGPPLLL